MRSTKSTQNPVRGGGTGSNGGLKAIAPRIDALLAQDRDLRKRLAKEAVEEVPQAEMSE